MSRRWGQGDCPSRCLGARPRGQAPVPTCLLALTVRLLCALCPLRSAIGEVYGVPKVHYKGQQDDFYVMVRPGRGGAAAGQ